MVILAGLLLGLGLYLLASNTGKLLRSEETWEEEEVN